MSDDFKKGYEYWTLSAGLYSGNISTEAYIDDVNEAINELVEVFNGFEGDKTDISCLKGFMAEYWHAGTFNINAKIHHSNNRAVVGDDIRHKLASADIKTRDGKKYGLKYYADGAKSAKAQSMSVFERFREYQASGGKDSINDYLRKNGYTDNKVLNDPIYTGQIRIIPTDQMKEAVEWLEKKIAKEKSTRPEQVKRYQETLDMLRDRLKDSKGNESIPLSKDDAEKLAELARKGSIDAKELGLTTEELMGYVDVLQDALHAGLTATVITVVLQVTPEIYKLLDELIKTGNIDGNELKETGFIALSAGGESFIRGSVSAMIVGCSKCGFWGESLKSISPSVVATLTVVMMDTMKNAFMVSTGKMSQQEMTNELIRTMFVSSLSLAGGGIMQTFTPELPVFGYMLGSFVGSIIGSFAYNQGYSRAISFCVDSGFTFFGLVDQNYELPKDVLEYIGIEVFDYEKSDYEKFKYKKFEYEKFDFEKVEPELIDMHVLRRGVIGVNRVGYI